MQLFWPESAAYRSCQLFESGPDRPVNYEITGTDHRTADQRIISTHTQFHSPTQPFLKRLGDPALMVFGDRQGALYLSLYRALRLSAQQLVLLRYGFKCAQPPISSQQPNQVPPSFIKTITTQFNDYTGKLFARNAGMGEKRVDLRLLSQCCQSAECL
jgi:hypothetical protein